MYEELLFDPINGFSRVIIIVYHDPQGHVLCTYLDHIAIGTYTLWFLIQGYCYTGFWQDYLKPLHEVSGSSTCEPGIL